MNKKNGLIVIVILLVVSLFILNVSGIFTKTTHCGVSFDDTVYEFKDSSGNSIFVIDEGGNLYLNASDVDLGVTGADPTDGFSIKSGSNWYWTFSNTLAQVKGDILEGETLPESIGSDMVMFRNPVDETPLVLFNVSSGNILVKGMAVYYNSQANCTADDYYTDSGTRWWKDNYCDESACVFENVSLDENQALCTDDSLPWAIGGDIPSDCCGDDTTVEFKITRKCTDEAGMCSDDPSDDGCCNASNECVQGSECTTGGEITCADWNSSIKVRCINGNKWMFNEDCTKKCTNICTTYAGCTGDDCAGLSYCENYEFCDEGNGCVDSLQYCDNVRTCSTPGDDGYDDSVGTQDCLSTCDGEGNCDFAYDCNDCTQIGSFNGCACTCGGFGEIESTDEGNCGDFIDNDCDGDIDDADSDCCADLDGDGWSSNAACNTPAVADCDDDPDTGGAIYQYLTCYVDGDRDGQGTGSSSQVCSGESCPTGYSDNNDDCCDSNDNAYLGSSYSSSSQTGCGSGGYDYNCDGSSSRVENCDTCTTCSKSGPPCEEPCFGYSDGEVDYNCNGVLSCGQRGEYCEVEYSWKQQGSCGDTNTIEFIDGSGTESYCSGDDGHGSAGVISTSLESSSVACKCR